MGDAYAHENRKYQITINLNKKKDSLFFWGVLVIKSFLSSLTHPGNFTRVEIEMLWVDLFFTLYLFSQTIRYPVRLFSSQVSYSSITPTLNP